MHKEDGGQLERTRRTQMSGRSRATDGGRKMVVMWRASTHTHTHEGKHEPRTKKTGVDDKRRSGAMWSTGNVSTTPHQAIQNNEIVMRRGAFLLQSSTSREPWSL